LQKCMENLHFICKFTEFETENYQILTNLKNYHYV
jgi:hypothetical protein